MKSPRLPQPTNNIKPEEPTETNLSYTSHNLYSIMPLQFLTSYHPNPFIATGSRTSNSQIRLKTSRNPSPPRSSGANKVTGGLTAIIIRPGSELERAAAAAARR